MNEVTAILNAIDGGDAQAAARLLPLVYGELRQLAASRLALDEALTRLAAKDVRKAKLVELRYFAGLTLDEAAAVLGVSPATADRDWAFARAWLHRELAGPG